MLKDKNEELKSLNNDILNSLYKGDSDDAILEEEINKWDEYITFYLIESKFNKLVKSK